MFFEFILSLLIVFLTYRILMTFSSIESVLLLILLAVNFSMLLFFYGVNFLAILYLAVYIGAVTVFFLFVVMMTDISSSVYSNVNNFHSDSINLIGGYKYKLIYLSFILVLGYYFANLFLIILNFSEFGLDVFALRDNAYNNLYLDQFNVNIEIIGFSIFNEHAGPFIISSLVILIALIGSIFITTLVSESENNKVIPSCSPMLVNVNLTENNKSQEMEVQLVRQFLNSIYLNLNK